MSRAAKTGQLQIRVSIQQKDLIQRAAARAGMDMSSYVLSRVLPVPAQRFSELVRAIPRAERFALAELNTFLSSVTPGELREATATLPVVKLSAYLPNYIAAMVEMACSQRGIEVPEWVQSIPVLTAPVFGSTLQSVRLHLLMRSPPAFRRRNLFIDSSIGDRV